MKAFKDSVAKTLCNARAKFLLEFSGRSRVRMKEYVIPVVTQHFFTVIEEGKDRLTIRVNEILSGHAKNGKCITVTISADDLVKLKVWGEDEHLRAFLTGKARAEKSLTLVLPATDPN